MSSKILTALFVVGGASALYAGPVYSCGGGSACDGNLYAVWVASQTATSYVLDVGVQVTSNYLTAHGGPGSNSDFINTLSIVPDNQGFAQSTTLLSHPAGIWNIVGGSAPGVCNGVTAPNVCAGANGMGANLFTYSSGVFLPNTDVWQFTVTGTPPSLGDTAHLSFRFINNMGATVASPSFNADIQCIGGGTCDSNNNFQSLDVNGVPEPTTSALIGSGLIGLYFIRRRLQN